MAADQGHPADPRRLVVPLRGARARRGRREHRQQPGVSPLLPAPFPHHRLGDAVRPHGPGPPGHRRAAGRHPRHPARAGDRRARQPEASARVVLRRPRGARSPAAEAEHPLRPLAPAPDARRLAARHRAEGSPWARYAAPARVRPAPSGRGRACRGMGDRAASPRPAPPSAAPRHDRIPLRPLRQDGAATVLRRGGARLSGRAPGAASRRRPGRERGDDGAPARAGA